LSIFNTGDASAPSVYQKQINDVRIGLIEISSIYSQITSQFICKLAIDEDNACHLLEDRHHSPPLHQLVPSPSEHLQNFLNI
jgi:hypothetical protein